MVKYIFVTGGVTSSLGKGIIAASLAKLLQARGYRTTIQKFDPYINIDPGTLNPYEHGECFVTDDGAETDLDLGHYERFLNVPTSQDNNVTTGRIYDYVTQKERRGEYNGKTVQIIPHVTDEIQRRFKLLGDSGKYDIIITELGGTVGDIESLPYIEAVRQMKIDLGDENCMVIHLTYIPYISAAKELKTKPTQHSVKKLNENGVIPNIIVCRTEHPLGDEIKQKVALFCNVRKERIIESRDAKSIYLVPLMMQEEGLDMRCLEILHLPTDNAPDLTRWNAFVDRLNAPQHRVKIGLVGKYVELQDAYKSILEALKQAGVYNDCEIQIVNIHSESITKENVVDKLKDLDGVLVAPGFGKRGIEGKIVAIQYVRENKIPFFGICLGMQCAVIEFARNVLGLENANSTEMESNCEYPVIHLMEDQKNISKLGGTMRLGAYPCRIEEDSLAFKLYGATEINERHRHRYEFNNDYLLQMSQNGMKATGINPENNLVEIVEIPNHPFFIAGQFHPEYKSTVENPHPLFLGFVKAALENQHNTK